MYEIRRKKINELFISFEELFNHHACDHVCGFIYDLNFHIKMKCSFTLLCLLLWLTANHFAYSELADDNELLYFTIPQPHHPIGDYPSSCDENDDVPRRTPPRRGAKKLKYVLHAEAMEVKWNLRSKEFVSKGNALPMLSHCFDSLYKHMCGQAHVANAVVTSILQATQVSSTVL